MRSLVWNHDSRHDSSEVGLEWEVNLKGVIYGVGGCGGSLLTMGLALVVDLVGLLVGMEGR